MSNYTFSTSAHIAKIYKSAYNECITFFAFQMKKLFILVILIFGISLYLGRPVFAAPAPWGIAIKESEEKCAGYWGGDEFVAYGLPIGWTAYYPDTVGDDAGIISTPFGKCNFYEGEESCCKALGLSYISENIGRTGEDGIIDEEDNDHKLGGLIDPTVAIILGGVCCCATTLLLVGGAGIFLVAKKKKSPKGYK